MSKLSKIRNEIKDKVDAILVFDEINQYYFTEFKFSDGAVLITQDKAYLITDFRYYEEAQNAVSCEWSVVMPANRMEFIRGVVSDEKCKTVGVEADSLSYSRYTDIKNKLGDVILGNVSPVISLVRRTKNEAELEKIYQAQLITDSAFKHILNVLTFDMTEIDVSLELEFFMRKNGAHALAFDTIAVSGDASALPHGTPRNVKLKSGFLTMDFGASFCGYCSDMTRTVSIGKATPEMKKIYETTLEAQALALQRISAGENCRDIDSVARDHIENAGYKGAFGHSLGHGVGMFIHENPRLSQSAVADTLKVGDVVTVEPGIYLPGHLGCRIEDMVFVGENGCQNITKSPKELIEIY